MHEDTESDATASTAAAASITKNFFIKIDLKFAFRSAKVLNLNEFYKFLGMKTMAEPLKSTSLQFFTYRRMGYGNQCPGAFHKTFTT